MKRAIIAGATGAIGTALIRELISNNIEVLVLVRPESERKDNILNCPLVSIIECGMCQYSTLQNDTNKKYDVFYHFAWAGASGPGRHDMYLQNLNVKYALDAVGMAKRFGCHRFVGAGSQAEYGRVEGILKPDTPTFPEMGYGYAKLCAGLMTREYAHEMGLEHIWVRVLSVYGPNDGKQSMIMTTINKLQLGQKPRFTQAEQMWDFLYSRDAAEAFRLIGEDDHDGKTYVLGNGQVRPLREYIQELADIVRPGEQLKFGEIPYGEKQVMYLCADTSELKKDVNWEPRTTFNMGIGEIING